MLLMRAATRASESAGVPRLLLLDFLELAMADELLEAALEQLVERRLLELAPTVLQGLLDGLHRRFGVAVRAAERLVHDLVDQAERLQARSGDAERLRRFRRIVGALPQDGGAALGRDHGIGRVLEDVDEVPYRDSERAAGAAFADDGAQDRHAQLGHGIEVAADRFRLAALLGPDARIRARRVHEREYRHAELLGELHQPQGLAVALGLGHAEIAENLLLGVAPLLVADHHAGLAVEAREPADNGGVVGEAAVAVQLLEAGEEIADVVERVRALRVARHQRDLPRAELAVDFLGERLAFLLELRDLRRDVERGVVLHEAQLLDLGLELGDRLLEFQEGVFHAGLMIPDGACGG